ncbi:unnamed protein product, partial [Adineta ricciae]
MKLLQTVQSNQNDDEDTLDESSCLGQHLSLSSSSSMYNPTTLSVHASPLLTRLTVVNFDTDVTPIRILIKADWSDNNSTLAWKTPNDIRSFHLQLSNIVYHDDIRLERLMNISGYLRDIGFSTEADVEQMKKNIGIYMAHLVYFSSYISTISTLAKFFNSSLKLVDSKQRLFNSNNTFEDSLPSSPSYSNGMTPLQCELPIQQTDSDSKTLCSPKLSLSIAKSKQQLDVAKQARSTVPTHNGTQTGLEVRCEETQTDRMPGPGFILAEHQDFLRRYSMDELAKLTPHDLIVDGLDSSIAQLLCGALDDLKPMSIHLSNSTKAVRSPCTFVQIPTASSSSTSPPPPLLDAALMTVVQQQQQPQASSSSSSRTSPPGFDRNQFEHILINFAGMRSSVSSSPSPKLPKSGTNNTTVLQPTSLQALPAPATSTSSSTAVTSSSSNAPPPTQHHVPLLTAHSFLYNPVEPCIFPIAIPPGFPSTSPDLMRFFAPNMAAVAAAAVANTTNPSNTNFLGNSNSTQGSMSSSRSTTQSNGTNTPPEQNGQNLHHSSASTTSSTVSRHQQPHFRHRQHYPSDSQQYQQNSSHTQQRQGQTSYSQQQQQQQQQLQHSRPKACYTCGGFGHLAFACPEQYLSDSNYSHSTREGYRLDYRPRQSTPTNFHQQQQQQQQRQMRSNSNSKTKLRDN